MPFQKLQYKPGYYTEATRIDSGDRFIFGDHIRFFKGFAKKIGGSVKNTIDSFLGACRGLRAWVSLEGKKFISIGTNLKLYISEGGVNFDITPIRESGTYALDPISTTDLSTSVNIHDVDHGLAVGDYIHISGAAAVGGLTIDGEYTVTTVVDADNFTITSPTPASSTATGGGVAVDYEYEIPIGSANTLILGGWGSGPWSAEEWGTPRTGGGFVEFARTWSGGNFGEDGVFSPRGLGIYIWIASTGTSVRAVRINNSPDTNLFVLISPEDRYIISLGAHDGSDSDPMLIRWCSQNDPTVWTPATTNTAGDKRLSSGNLILAGVSSRGQIIISTDTTIYSMFPDSEFVFSFDTKGVGGTVSPNGMVEYNGIVYWFGANNFYLYDGTIRIMRCDVRSFVFSNFDALQSYKVYGFVNSDWNEIWWFWQAKDGTGWYVAYDFEQDIWHFGTREMSAGVDRGVVSDTPLTTGNNGFLYNIESGVDEDGVALSTELQTGALQISQRNRFVYLKKILPNFISLTGSMNMSVTTRLFPQDPNPVTSQDYVITSTTKYISLRQKGDEFSLSFSNNTIGSDFYFGNNEVEIMEAGIGNG